MLTTPDPPLLLAGVAWQTPSRLLPSPDRSGRGLEEAKACEGMLVVR